MKRFFQILALTLLSPASAFAFPCPIRETTAPKLDGKQQPQFYVPIGTTNLALDKPVTSSDDAPIIGELSMITDGEKCPEEGCWVELGPGTQWVQIDLGKRSRIFGIQLWHYFGGCPRAYRDVVVQVCDESTFTQNVRTIYNNDEDNTSNLGKGKDKEFYDSNRGYRIDTRGKNYEGIGARFVRIYSRGNTDDPQNQYVEVEVIGKPLASSFKINASGLRPWTFRRLTTPASQKSSQKTIKQQAPALPQNFLVPRETIDAAINQLVSRKVLSSSFQISQEKLNSIIFDTEPKSALALPPGLQWVQIDLGRHFHIHAIQLWHKIDDARIYRDVIVQVADDVDFRENLRTLYNNDRDNSAGLGRGKDREYAESENGLVIDARGPASKGATARYIRFYSRGSNIDALNHYLHIEVAGQIALRHPRGRPYEMLWQTKIPAPAYMNR